jgi:GntR family transcriptional regulator / MocR family aminotransferase
MAPLCKNAGSMKRSTLLRLHRTTRERYMDYQFLLATPKHAMSVSRQRRLYNNLRAAIAAERLVAHHHLPSSRELAQQLDIARNTVVHAYEQLTMEGYLRTTRRGTFVAPVAAPIKERSKPPWASIGISRRIRALPKRSVPDEFSLPFTPGVPALDEFPLQEWHRMLRRACASIRPNDLGYGDARGNILLRTAISDRLRAARNVRCTPQQVFITNGTQSTLDLVACVLADVGDTVWVESPGYGGAFAAFTAAGLLVRAVSVDGEGINLDRVKRLKKPRLIYVTPSHQYPLGSVLSLQRRMELINVAWRVGALILEDDYDSDFWFSGEPLPSLQGLVEDSPVLYLGTFSKTMFPGLRLGYLVVPPAAAEPLASIYGALQRHGRQMEQVALADFIIEGRYTRHLNRMRKLYRDRHRALRDALSCHLPLPVDGAETGLHLVLRLPHDTDDVEIVRRARKCGLNPAPLSLCVNETMPRMPGLVLGYANLSTTQVRNYVRVLATLCK